MVTFEDPKGTVMEVFKRGDVPHQKFPTRASCRTSSATSPSSSKTSRRSPISIATCSASGFGLDGRSSSRSCAAASITTPST
jgi:hypothetical protein